MAAPQQGQPDNSAGFIWITVVLLAAGALIWYKFKTQLINTYFLLKLGEIKVISIFTTKLDTVHNFILTSDPKTLSFQDVILVGEKVGAYVRFPLILLLAFLAFLVFNGHSTRIFKRTYSMRDLVQMEQANWPQITPVANLDLIKANIDQGPWAMAVTPMQFCKRHKLLEEHRRQAQEGQTRKEWSRVEVTLKRGQANKVFALQLGALWQGTEKLPPHLKALFAIFAARYNNDTSAAYEFLRKISASSATKLDFSGADALLKKHEDTKGVQKIINGHAYVLTTMASMLEAARQDGVQASSDFIWLKPVDRRFWYMLNTVGRQTPFVEVAGPFAHWVAEKEIGKRLIVPMVEEATNALEGALKDILYKPDEEEEEKT